jgi:hypothetical protein
VRAVSFVCTAVAALLLTLAVVAGYTHLALLHSERFADVEEATSFYMANFGPAVALSAQLPPERIAALRDAIATWARTTMQSGALEMEYLLTIARRA